MIFCYRRSHLSTRPSLCAPHSKVFITSPYWSIYYSLFHFHLTIYKSTITFFDIPFFKLFFQKQKSFLIFCYQQNPRCLSIQWVNNPRSFYYFSCTQNKRLSYIFYLGIIF